MKVLKMLIVVAVAMFLMSQSASAQPTFQVYSPDNFYAGDYHEDQDTWFVQENPFELWAIGAYHGITDALQDVRLVVSVPEGQLGLGSITITGALGTGTNNPTFLGSYTDTSFFPSGVKFNNHYPLKKDVSDFLVYDIDDHVLPQLNLFRNVGDVITDYDADNGGSETLTTTTGQVKEYTVGVSGFTAVHFDMFGTEVVGIDHKIKTSWEMAPGSHDVTWIPAPGSILLGSIGVCLVGWLRRRRTL